MNEILDEFMVGRLPDHEFENAIEFHMQGLEQIDLTQIHEARHLTRQIVDAHFWDGDEEFGDIENARRAATVLRDFLRSLGNEDADALN